MLWRKKLQRLPSSRLQLTSRIAESDLCMRLHLLSLILGLKKILLECFCPLLHIFHLSSVQLTLQLLRVRLGRVPTGRPGAPRKSSALPWILAVSRHFLHLGGDWNACTPNRASMSLEFSNGSSMRVPSDKSTRRDIISCGNCKKCAEPKLGRTKNWLLCEWLAPGRLHVCLLVSGGQWS